MKIKRYLGSKYLKTSLFALYLLRFDDKKRMCSRFWKTKFVFIALMETNFRNIIAKC